MLKVKKTNIFKYINKNHIFSRFVFIGIILFPSKSLNFLGGFPIKSFPKFIFIFFVCFLIFKIDSISKNHFVIFFLILVFKISTPFIFDNVWNVCVSDNTTPRQTQFEYIYIERDCVKSFDSLNNSQTLEVSKIEYGVIFDEYKWMGHNATNFPVGFLNHSAFNFYEKRRDWLPFKINLQKDLDELSEYVEISYVGYVKLNFYPSDLNINLPINQDSIETVILKIPYESEKINMEYFYRDQGILQDATRPFNVPNVFTDNKMNAHLFVKELDINRNEIPSSNLVYYEYLLIILLFYFLKSSILLLDKKEKSVFFIVVFLILITQFYEIRFENNLLEKIIGYGLLLFAFTLVSKLEFSKIHSLAVLVILISLNFFIIDEPWNLLDFNVKPSGTDILTYENQARLILEGEGFRGGEDVFWYSPGYRYALMLIHVIFGDGWNIAWKAILSFTIFFLLKLGSRNLFIVFPLILFLSSDNVRTLYLYGMSETLSLFLFLLSLLFYNSKKLFLTLISCATIIRPDIIFLTSVLILFNFKVRDLVFPSLVLVFPLIHNLYYGNSFVPFSTGATYGRNLNFEFIDNIEYLIFNIFNLEIRNILGLVPTSIAFYLILLNIIYPFLKYFRIKNPKILINILFWVLVIIPYLVYDPRLFFPRHVLIGLVILCIDFSSFSFNFPSFKKREETATKSQEQ